MPTQRHLAHVDMAKIVSLAKRRGFVFPASEIYGGAGSTYDFGPLGVELKRNIKDAWWRAVVYGRDDVVGLDSAILQSPRVWVASGHAASFADPFVACPACGRNYRGDHVWGFIADSAWWQSLQKALDGTPAKDALVRWAKGKGKELAPNLALVQHPEPVAARAAAGPAPADGTSTAFRGFLGQLASEVEGDLDVPCPNCGGPLSEPEPAALMLETVVGPVRATGEKTYLRPETAQGIFTNFDNVLTSTRMRLPFGIAQVGKSFRNEITPGNFLFRTREFEQMEMEFFVRPGEDDRWHAYWLRERFDWYTGLGMQPDRLRIRAHERDELAHYAKACADVEYAFPWGWAELEGIANRTDFDLKAHSAASGTSLTYFEQETNERFTPYVIEPAAGVDRTALALLVDAYDEDPDGSTQTRTVLHFHPDIAPVQVAVLPLSRNEKLVPTARDLYAQLRPRFVTQYDDAQSIGRRYRRQDEIGTPLCVTVDFDTVEKDQAVTIRNRDSMQQVRIAIAELDAALRAQLREMGSRRA